MSYDLLIKDARVVDGSGMPAYGADVGIRDARIVEIGRLGQSARRTIDAGGLALAPGFIDHHTHLDAHLLWDPLARSSPEHGVTTVITGNCGLSLMPARPGDESAIIGTFVRVEAIPRSILESVSWRWNSVADYLAAVGERPGVNVASMVGHNAVRQYVMGDDATEREATPDEIEAMRGVLRQAMRDGAAGFTINRNRSHYRDDGKPLPSRLASEAEMLGLAGVLSEFNAGTIQHSNMGAHRIENIDWFARLGRAAGRPVLWSSVNWRPDAPDLWCEQLQHVSRYFDEGLRLYGNTNIIPTSNRFTLRNAQLFDEFPAWRAVLSLPLPERRRSLAQAATRDALRRDLLETPRPTGQPGFHRRWDLITVLRAQRPEQKALEGRTVEELAIARGADPLDAFLDLALQEDLETLFLSSNHPDDEVVAGIMRSPYTNIGMSDAGAHVAFLAGFGVSSLVLGHWVRQRHLMSLEEAVHRLTFKVASIFGLRDRGLIWPGWAADLVLFDPETVQAEEPEEAADYPGGFTRMVQHARGVFYTIVNGEVLLEQGEHTGAYPGKVIRNAWAEAEHPGSGPLRLTSGEKEAEPAKLAADVRRHVVTNRTFCESLTRQECGDTFAAVQFSTAPPGRGDKESLKDSTMSVTHRRRITVSVRRDSRPMVRRAFLGGAGAAALALAGCKGGAAPKSARSASGSSSGSGAPATGGIFTTSVNQNPSTLDGIALYNLSTWPLSSSVLSRLVRNKSSLDPQTAVSGDLESDLALSLESPDGLTWTAKLRPDARFHAIAPVNGRLVDSQDVKASLAYAVKPENSGSPFLTMIDPSQIETPASDTVVFKLRSVYGPFAQTIAGPGFVMPREGTTGGYDPSKTMIGSGPFLLQSYQPDIALTYTKNPAWFETGRPYVDSMRSPILADTALQNAQFIAGALDELNPAATDEETIKRQRPNSTVVPVTETPVWVMYGHMDRPGAYRDARVRQAVSVALDRATLGKGVLNNSFTTNPVLGTEYGKWALGFDQVGSAAQYLKYDLATAKKLVEAAGVGDQIQKFCYVRDVYGQDKMAEAINPMLNAAGFKTALVPLDYQKDFTAGGKGISSGNYPTDMIILARYGIGVPTPEDYLRLTSQPGLTRNPSQVNDAQLTAMIAKMLTLRDEGQRLQAVYEIQRYLAGQLYLIPVPVPVLHRFIQARVHNYSYAINANAGTGTYAKLWVT